MFDGKIQGYCRRVDLADAIVAVSLGYNGPAQQKRSLVDGFQAFKNFLVAVGDLPIEDFTELRAKLRQRLDLLPWKYQLGGDVSGGNIECIAYQIGFRSALVKKYTGK